MVKSWLVKYNWLDGNLYRNAYCYVVTPIETDKESVISYVSQNGFASHIEIMETSVKPMFSYHDFDQGE